MRRCPIYSSLLDGGPSRLDLGEVLEGRWRELAGERPEVFEPDLAVSLVNLGDLLTNLGDLGEAKKVTEEAISIFRKLTVRRPGAYEEHLA